MATNFGFLNIHKYSFAIMGKKNKNLKKKER
jgi:hypothetical protein